MSVYLDDLENSSILLDQDKDLEEDITHLFKYFYFQLGSKTQPIRLKIYSKLIPQYWVTSNNFKYVSSIATVYLIYKHNILS